MPIIYKKKKKKTKASLAFIALALACLAACGKNEPAVTVGETTEEPVPEVKMVTIADKNGKSDFVLVVDDNESDGARLNLLQVRDAVSAVSGKRMETVNSILLRDSYKKTVLFGSIGRESSEKANAELAKDEYIIRFCRTDEGGELVVAYNGAAARMCAVDRLIDDYISDDGFIVPEDLDIKGKCGMKDAVVTTSIQGLRDPFILRTDDGTYYAYGTGWRYYKSNKLDGIWRGPYSCVNAPADAIDNHWAPEVHFYNGAYYMITTYKSAKTGHRGCTVMKSLSPEGPFVEISDGHITPKDWDSIDGTLYIDGDGTPWMIFVHEWTSTSDGIGRMAAARLSSDLSSFVSEPHELFTARDPGWAKNNVTDGCFMYRAADGKLWMLWSNWDSEGYCVGLAYSEDGTVTGKWKQEARRLYTKSLGFDFDGGHGMLFSDADGSLKLALHSPNSSSAGRSETTVILPVTEKYGKLVLDFYKPREE
ncbi:MAG: glycoside hydrolase family 43 protein [Clostridia bacterium]|nr:glycoside hydrolase family 43 protein [Clostridia bacterium]